MKKPRNYWTKENCSIEAFKYSTKSEFKKKSSGAYDACIRNKWIDGVSNHVLRLGNRHKKCIYSYEFSDNHVYVGLTSNIEERQKRRDRNIKDSVTEHILKTNLQPNRILLTKYIEVNKAIKMEEYYVNKYNENGWNILNKVKTGAIGGNIVKLTKEFCTKEALKYKTKTDFNKGNSSAYVTARKEKWINDICKHMTRPLVHNFKYTYDVCEEEALKYDNVSDFNKLSTSIYVTSCRNKWLKEICKHMKK